jgi:hypothetical protein
MLEKLKELLDKDPFRAFKIILTSGTAYEVMSPYQVAIGQTQFDYFFPRSDRSAMIRLKQIVAFETMDQAAAN